MKMCWNGRILGLGAVAVALVLAGPACAQELGPVVCGSLDNPIGPFDYRTDRKRLRVVEQFHFNPDVESLKAGLSTHNIGGDIGYTLRAYPNHHRALHAMARLALKERTTRPRGTRYTVDCWFDRALRFTPDDAMVPLTYGIYLFQVGKKEKALEMLQAAERIGTTDVNFHYNIGLLYADMGRYDEALPHAHEAYARGFNLPGLRNKLERAGKWRDPRPGSSSKVAPASGEHASSDAPE